MSRIRIIIMGAAGRDFHNFNVYFRENSTYEVVAFTAAQIPDIDGREYPPELAGRLYPRGIPIYAESELPNLLDKYSIDQVIFAYSDVSHQYVMHKASEVISSGSDFRLMGTASTQLQSDLPVISICAVRTGSGKSQTTRRVVKIFRKLGYSVAVVRHPMPYGDLSQQAVQRFVALEDLNAQSCTIEEREEYEPHIELGSVVYAGVDYQRILEEAENEANIIIWDGGNNDLPFYKSDLHIVIADPLRKGHEFSYHPGESNLRMADVVVVNKVDSAGIDNVHVLRETIRSLNQNAVIVEAASPIFVDDPQEILGKRVLAVEDGPTITHGEMKHGAAWIAAKRHGASEIIDPRPFAIGSLAETYEVYPWIGSVLPAMGYSTKQIHELEDTINRTSADVVLVGTPINLGRVANLRMPWKHVRYELQEIGYPTLEDILVKRFGTRKSKDG